MLGQSSELSAPVRAAPRLGAVIAVHSALVLGTWLFATLLYAVLIAKTRQWGWLAFDSAVVAVCAWLVHARSDALGFRSLGARRGWKLVAILAFGTLCALLVQIAVRDRNGIWLDETHYLWTLRAETIIREGRLPYNLRWLVPLLAGRWNMIPVDDIDAIKAINFGAFAVTAGFLVLLLVRLRVALWIALTAPAFLLASYFGIYGGSNRLVLDPSNYALYVVLFHLLIRREHWPMFAGVLLLDAFNAEKALYWVPVFGLVALLRWEPPPASAGTGWRALWASPTVKQIAWCCLPTVIYLTAIRLYLAPSSTEWNLCFDNIHKMAFSELGAEITNPNVLPNSFQMMWLPFGPFTIYALLGFTIAERWMKPVALLVIPIFVQNLIACDGQRMVAYTFIVYLPFGYLYLSRMLSELPRALSYPVLALATLLVILQHYLFVVANAPLHLSWAGIARSHPDDVKLYLSALELVLVTAIVFVHFTFYAGRRAGNRATVTPP